MVPLHDVDCTDTGGETVKSVVITFGTALGNAEKNWIYKPIKPSNIPFYKTIYFLVGSEVTGHGEKAAVAMDLRKTCSDSVVKSTLVQVAPTPVLIFVKLSILT